MDSHTDSRKKVLLLFGGQSSEHEVSCRSAATIAAGMDRQKYRCLPVGITKEGAWLKADSPEQILSGEWIKSPVHASLLPDASLKSVLFSDGKSMSLEPVDVVFPVLHGLYGEDGCPQGIAELAQIPYVGCDVLSSAVTMDKATSKAVLAMHGIPQARFASFRREELETSFMGVVLCIEALFPYPVFVKPSNAGSSCGVSKAADRSQLEAALRLACCHDCKIVVEETIRGRELECALLGGWDAEASGVGEILSSGGFYDYDSKYITDTVQTLCEAELPPGKREEIRTMAKKIFRLLDCRGLSRADFFLEAGTDRVVFNEINTMPGFTSISMYPKLWESAGIPLPELVSRLIESAAVTCRRKDFAAR